MTPSTDDRRFPEGVVLTAAALLGAVMVLAGLVIGRQVLVEEVGTAAPTSTSPLETAPPAEPAPGDRGEGTVPGPTTTTTTEPADPSDGQVEPLTCPDRIDEVICEAARFVQIERERPFRTFPEVEILPDADFDTALLDDFDSYRADIEAYAVTLTALDLLEPGTDLVEVYRQSYTLGVVGFYDPTIERLVVRGDEFGLYAQLVLVHELTHALDDQWFDLDREMADGDADYGFAAVVEGNASRVEEAWRSSLGPADQAALAVEEMGSFTADDLAAYAELPPVVLEVDISPYVDGLIWATNVARAGGEAAIDGALTEPPTSSEEILHPTTDRALDPEVELDGLVADPAVDGVVAEEGRLGELLIRQWLGRGAGAGWGGDRYVSWTDGEGRACVLVEVAGDVDTDLDDIRSAAEEWVAGGSGRTVVDGGDRATPTVRLAGCS